VPIAGAGEEGGDSATSPMRGRLTNSDPDSDLLLKELSVGQVAARSGVAVSSIHFYERKGLIKGRRSGSNQRRFPREVLRRVAVIKAAQRVGISLNSIREAFRSLPQERIPTAKDWEALSTDWRADLDDRIVRLTRLRDELSNCIGCGCLSLDSCPLLKPNDKLSRQGPGPG
jgi:MerR family transcriptional regulator, redox-sensitive transcriptional activator SoxR